MLEQDYLMRMLLQFFKALVRSNEMIHEGKSPQDAADSLEDAVSNTTEMDGAALLSLSPESIAQIMRVTGIDPNVTQFVARSMLLESVYLHQANDHGLAQIRALQAKAIAKEYGFDLPPDPSDFDSITQGLEEAALAGGFDSQADPLSEFEEFLNL